jgi:hypothetical protein
MKRKLFFIILTLLVLTRCNKKQYSTQYLDAPAAVPMSFLSIDVDLPVAELEELLEKKLQKKLMNEEKIPLNGSDKDFLFLTLERYDRLELEKRGESLHLNVPLFAEIYISKRILGMQFKNDDNPVRFKCIAGMSTQAELDENWNLNLDANWEELKWVEEPVFSIMGIDFELTQIVESAINSFSPSIERIVTEASNNAIDFRKTVVNINDIIQKPNRVLKNPFLLYVSASNDEFRGAFQNTKKDTLTLHTEISSQIRFSPMSSILNKKNPVKSRSNPLNNDNVISAYAELLLSYEDIKANFNALFGGRNFEYEGYTFNLTIEKIGVKDELINLLVNVGGDVSGQVEINGIPEINKKLELSFSSFEYEILDVDDDRLSSADNAFHNAIERQIGRMLKMDLYDFLMDLDKKAVEGIENGNLTSKIDLKLDIKEVEPYLLAVSSEEIQLILRLDGGGSLTLKNGIFNN